MPPLRLTHLGICVENLDRSISFYRDGLGFREVGRLHVGDAATARILEVEGAQLELVYLEHDGWRIELLHYASPHEGTGERRAMNALGLTHLSFAVEDLDAVADAIQRHGGRVLPDTRAVFQSGNRGLFTPYPDGTRIQLIEQRPASGRWCCPFTARTTRPTHPRGSPDPGGHLATRSSMPPGSRMAGRWSAPRRTRRCLRGRTPCRCPSP